ncbi:MAG: hypothetical protein CVT66_05830 [Actinobacteria bacterium HGW-Actinobacteria-6]|jgi:ATP-dependent exoDNAse (exonuclease V) beta subunit|nr:MAG: hypothetical protein CVT66_05830 [Actinobacteria bacterium HGW-Actinobacteria-6]
MKMSLAPEQDAVVHAGAGDIFVAAAAGSGKTRVLVARFVAAVLGEIPLGPCGVTDVLAVTFTDKAAGEIAERVRGALLAEGRGAEARQVEQAWVSTIHSMCTKILRRYAFDAGLDPRFSVVTQVEAGILEQEAFESATRALMTTDSGVKQLVLDLGASRIASMVASAHGTLRSMGRVVSDVQLALVPSDRDVREWCAEFESIAEVYPTLGATKTIEAGADSAIGCAVALRAYLGSVDRAMEARTALQALGEAAFRRQGSQSVKEHAEAAQALVAKASGGLAQVVAAPYEEALLRVVAAFDARYEETKAEQGVLDFEDLQLKTASLLESRPEIAARYQEAFRLVMIDEFQDTNALQLRIARALSSDDLLTVGDDKQSIYRFRHADVEVFRSLSQSAPAVHILRANYRSHRDVIEAVNEIFDSTTFFGGDFVRLAASREEQETQTWPAGESRVRFLLTDSRKAPVGDRRAMEASAIAAQLASLRAAGVPQGDMVILVRAMKGRSEGIETALRGEGFDVYVASGGTYFDRPEVDELTSLLSVTDNPRNDEALMKVLAGRLSALSEDSLFRIAAAARRGRLWDVLATPESLALEPAEKATLVRVVSAIEWLRRNRGRQGIAELVHDACERLDYDLTLFASGPDGPRAWANILKLARLAEEYERRSSGDLGGFLEYIALHRSLAPEKQATLTGEGIDAVRIMSIHAAKGLEFPVVVVADLASGGNDGCGELLLSRDSSPVLSIKVPKSLLPDGKSVESTTFTQIKDAEATEDIAEADRLLYVACTRARECLIMSATVDPAKAAEGSCAIDKLRRAAHSADPAEQLGGEVELGALAKIAIHVESMPIPEPSLCQPGDSRESIVLPVGDDQPPPEVPASMPRNVSYTGLSVYHACPYKFYATRVARLKTPETPGDAGPLGFGSAVHAALQLSTTEAPPAERIEAIARANALGSTDVHRLNAAVQAYLSSETARSVAGAERTHRECPFVLKLGETLLRGNIDLLAWHGAEAIVVDYKTGASALTIEEATERYRAQAECYALAVLKSGAQLVSVRFVEVERDCRETRFDFGVDGAAVIEEGLLATVDKISAGRFEPLSAYTAGACEDCPALGGMCPINPRRGAFAGADHTRR